jgi:hypothetical protein
MMSETVIETAVCGECGADVREGSLFCYSCGKPIRVEPVVEAEPAGDVVIDGTSSRPPLRSAASLRKQRRAFNRQPVEVTWEPRTGSPTAFVITTIVLVGAALFFLLLALYLR